MIVIRDIFQLHFGKAKEAIDLLKQGQEALKRVNYPVDRILVDVTGEYYTLVMETRMESLTKFEEALGNIQGMEEWQEIYRRFVPLVHSGRREVFREVG
jgi:hypothetical protein